MAGGKPVFTAIILSFRRPQNIAKICRALLKTPSVRKVILSNNNPAVHIRDWIDISDERLIIIEQPTVTACPIRFLLAQRDDGESFLFIDDDLFLLPQQLEKLCNSFRADSSVPLGIQGHVHIPSEHALLCGLYGTRRVDGLNRVYLCNRAHIDAFFRIVEQLGMPSGSAAWNSNYWDDMVLSRCGGRRPRILEIGAFIDCPTSGAPGIAVWKERDFFASRLTFHEQLDVAVPFAVEV